ncbi:hypothetical protein [Mesorhizobium australafricanum]|uniref:Uncharacterized protein n=1 Tax=Mesorhizobium australafricanum TaxID=3072311 RepID=A0ABU4X400_9HYPH|nr:hypothetical protein [Mesorhizobium sp. VK3E]MDX8443051.1 hypothetical protein [Mesorhizobium sp. VK3E]
MSSNALSLYSRFPADRLLGPALRAAVPGAILSAQWMLRSVPFREALAQQPSVLFGTTPPWAFRDRDPILLYSQTSVGTGIARESNRTAHDACCLRAGGETNGLGQKPDGSARGTHELEEGNYAILALAF